MKSSPYALSFEQQAEVFLVTQEVFTTNNLCNQNCFQVSAKYHQLRSTGFIHEAALELAVSLTCEKIDKENQVAQSV